MYTVWLRKWKWQIPEEPLAAPYYWCQGPLLGRGPAVEEHWSSWFNASALVWFSNFLTYLVFHSLISLSTVFICRSSLILRLVMYQCAFKWIGESWIESAEGFRCCSWRLPPIADFHRSIWVWVLLGIRGVCFLLIVLIIFRVASVFFSLLVR
jgi:hypothetical protein